MVRNLQRLLKRQVVQPQEIIDSGTPHVLACRRQLEEQIVILARLARIGERSRNRRRQSGDAPKFTQMPIIRVKVAKQDHVILVASIGAHRKRIFDALLERETARA